MKTKVVQHVSRIKLENFTGSQRLSDFQTFFYQVSLHLMVIFSDSVYNFMGSKEREGGSGKPEASPDGNYFYYVLRLM